MRPRTRRPSSRTGGQLQTHADPVEAPADPADLAVDPGAPPVTPTRRPNEQDPAHLPAQHPPQ